ncbi:MAG: RHS repeat-associated core domain-containing protein, partial [Deltaproteobacteria bacterium]|nr:RHS repeat-associated core domain-containing protein [Deltaproteobacteria bacterium]
PGQYRDAETGLSYNHWRYYESSLGRYLQPDPVADLGHSRFAYVRQNPLRSVDPAGLYIASADPGILEWYNHLAETPEGAKLVEQINADPKPTHLSDKVPRPGSGGGETSKYYDGGSVVSIDQENKSYVDTLAKLGHELQHSLDYNVHGLDIDYDPDRGKSQSRAKGTEDRVRQSCK